MLQISRSETSLKRDYPAQVFHCEFSTIFQKTSFTEHLWMTAPADSSIPTKLLFIDGTLFFFPSFFPFIIDICNYGSLLRKIFLLFTIVFYFLHKCY